MQIRFKGRKNHISFDFTVGVFYILTGVVLPVILIVISFLKVASPTGNTGFSTFVTVLLSGLFLSVMLIIAGTVIVSQAGKGKVYSKIIKNKGRIKIPVFIKESLKPLPKVSNSLYAACKRGYLGSAVIDLSEKELILDESSPEIPARAGDHDTIYELHRNIPLLQLFTGISAGLTAIAFLGRRAGIIAGVVLGLTMFIKTLYFIPAPVFFTEIKRPMPKVKPPAKTGNTEVDEILKDVGASQKELTRLNYVIANPKINIPLEESMKVLEDMLAYLRENNNKVKQLRQFMNYYLPTTVKLLQNYEELSKKDNKGENINNAMKKIEEMMEKVVEVFKREYDDLFVDKAMDISAEVEVMKTMIDINNEF